MDHLDLADRWLAAIEADDSDDPPAVKVLRNRPEDAVDTCWIEGQRVTDMERCVTEYPYFASARLGAGEPLSSDVLKCQLMPLDRTSYGVRFTADQWARLVDAFPEGVCDWALPSVGFTEAVPWLSFADGPGGRPLGAGS